MTMAPAVQRYLEAQEVTYRVWNHPLTQTAWETAHATHISGNRVAKAVVLRDGSGYLLVVVPATHHVRFELVQRWLGRPVELASEQEVGQLFPDCEVGAIPPLGQAYGLDVILDESLVDQNEVCFEGGDHQCLIQMSGEHFADLMTAARQGTFSTHD
ncbi:MAG: YbaK/EbsC family protein [Nitrospirota bacterium]|nr:YbaK/EbsC family protein [Nitrospirota bacterium]